MPSDRQARRDPKPEHQPLAAPPAIRHLGAPPHPLSPASRHHWPRPSPPPSSASSTTTSPMTPSPISSTTSTPARYSSKSPSKNSSITAASSSRSTSLGTTSSALKRKSLPDVSKEELEGTARSLSFSQVSNMTTPDKTVQEYYATMHLEEAEMPPQAFVTEIARGLRRAMGLHLFNFDMIRDADAANQSHYFVIDINYFPGYAKMPNYEAVMTDFFWSIVNGGGDEVPPHSAGEEVQILSGGNGGAGAVGENM